MKNAVSKDFVGLFYPRFNWLLVFTLISFRFVLQQRPILQSADTPFRNKADLKKGFSKIRECGRIHYFDFRECLCFEVAVLELTVQPVPYLTLYTEAIFCVDRNTKIEGCRTYLLYCTVRFILLLTFLSFLDFPSSCSGKQERKNAIEISWVYRTIMMPRITE